MPARQGLPFCVAGVGDLLALFRCISCRYCFGTNIEKPDLLGAPGRVFTIHGGAGPGRRRRPRPCACARSSRARGERARRGAELLPEGRAQGAPATLASAGARCLQCRAACGSRQRWAAVMPFRVAAVQAPAATALPAASRAAGRACASQGSHGSTQSGGRRTVGVHCFVHASPPSAGLVPAAERRKMR